MQIHDLKSKSPHRRKKIVGRGGKRGTTSGRGTKGQKARAGTSMRPELRDIIKKFPKLRGYKFSKVSKENTPVNLATIEKSYKDGEELNVKTLLEKGIISKKNGRMPAVKILGTGDISKKVVVSGLKISKTANDKISKAGGSIKEVK